MAFDTVVPLLGYEPRDIFTFVPKDKCTGIFTEALFLREKTRNSLTVLNRGLDE